MKKFILSSEDDPAFVVSLHKELASGAADKISVRLRHGSSERIRVIEFMDGGEVIVHHDRLEKFGLTYKGMINK